MSGEKQVGPPKKHASLQRRATVAAVVVKRSKHQLDYFFETTPLHGFYPMSVGSRWSKLFWFVLIIGSVFLAAYQIANVVLQYDAQSTAYQLTVVDPQELKFPDILLCNQNARNFTALQKFDLTDPAGQHLLRFIDRQSRDFSLTSLLDEAHKYNLVETYENDTKLLEAYLDRIQFTFHKIATSLGQTCAAMFSKCSQGGVIANSSRPAEEPCCGVVQAILTPRGICYVVRGQMQKKETPIFGNFGGLLSIRLHFNREAYLPANLHYEAIFVGVTHTYQTELDHELLVVQPQTRTIINLRPKRIVDINTKHYKCNKDSLDPIYLCQEKCENRAFQSLCGCTPFILGHLIHNDTNATICEVRETFSCVDQMKALIKSQVQKCKKSCEPPCERWTYSSSVQSIPVTIRQEATEQEKRFAGISQLEIYYTDMRYEEVSQFFTVTLDTLVGSIGGIIGIYLGGSVLALIHAVFTLVGFMHCGDAKILKTLLNFRRRRPHKTFRYRSDSIVRCREEEDALNENCTKVPSAD